MTTPVSGPADLGGQVALVTGAARGIGQAIALALAAAGADVAALDLQAPTETERRIQAAGRRALAVVADVASKSAIEGAVAEILGRLGRLGIVVNNAGVVERLASRGSTRRPSLASSTSSSRARSW